MDREESIFALMQREGYKILSQIKGEVSKKSIEQTKKSNFYEEIIEQIKEYNDRYNPNRIILASPIFWKEELLKELKDNELNKKIIQATCSSVDKNGINEVLKRPETKEALKQDRISQEINLVDELLKEISKNNLATYGLNDVENAVNSGAIQTILVTYDFIKQQREKGAYNKIEFILKTTESLKGKIFIISSNHEGGKKLDGLGGIAALLRYKII